MTLTESEVKNAIRDGQAFANDLRLQKHPQQEVVEKLLDIIKKLAVF